MENELPLFLQNHLQEMGVISDKHEELDNPVSDSLRESRFSGPVGTFDEFGDPEW